MHVRRPLAAVVLETALLALPAGGRTVGGAPSRLPDIPVREG